MSELIDKKITLNAVRDVSIIDLLVFFIYVMGITFFGISFFKKNTEKEKNGAEYLGISSRGQKIQV